MSLSCLSIDNNIQPDTEDSALPERYGQAMVAMLPRDPDWIFVYWEITGKSKASVAREHGPDIYHESRQVLRVHDMTSSRVGRHFDILVMFDAGNWYVHVPGAGRSYRCELGLITPSGSFISILTSNTVTLPQGGASDVMDARWMSVPSDFDKLLQRSGVDCTGKGSSEVAKSLAQRWERLQAVFSQGASWGGSYMASLARSKPGEKEFRFAADCELILYGATEPGSFVSVGGRKVRLNPDGTFSMRFALPAGDTDLLVRGMPEDEADVRQIDINVARSTADSFNMHQPVTQCAGGEASKTFTSIGGW